MEPVLVMFGAPPPQTIIADPVQTAVWPRRPAGALAVLVSVHASRMGSYKPPVSRLEPPQMSIFEPVHTAVWPARARGASVLFVGTQESPAGSYWPPVPPAPVPPPVPQTIMREPVQ